MAEHGRRPVFGIDALHFACDEVKRRLPGHAHELVFAASFTRIGAVLHKALAHHRIANARGGVRQLREPADVGRGRSVVLERLEPRELSVLNLRAEYAPMRRSDDAVRINRRLPRDDGSGERLAVVVVLGLSPGLRRTGAFASIDLRRHHFLLARLRADK